MALAQFLSAVRVIILDLNEIPSEFSERQTQYSKLFPTLTKEEIEDLAKISPDRFKTYTSSIFHGETGILDNHFKLTLKLLKNSWREIFSFKCSEYLLVKDLHKFRPWNSNKTYAFAKNFVDYLSYDVSAIKANFPQIIEAANLELLGLEVKRAPDFGLMPHDSIQAQDLSDFSIERLLELRCQLPTYLRIAKLSYDLLPAWDAVRNADEKFPDQIEWRDCFVVGARNRENLGQWLEIKKSIYDLFSNALQSKSEISLAQLAESFMTESNPNLSEAELFTQFMILMRDFLEYGVLIIDRSCISHASVGAVA